MAEEILDLTAEQQAQAEQLSGIGIDLTPEQETQARQLSGQLDPLLDFTPDQLSVLEISDPENFNIRREYLNRPELHKGDVLMRAALANQKVRARYETPELSTVGMPPTVALGARVVGAGKQLVDTAKTVTPGNAAKAVWHFASGLAKYASNAVQATAAALPSDEEIPDYALKPGQISESFPILPSLPKSTKQAYQQKAAENLAASNLAISNLASGVKSAARKAAQVAGIAKPFSEYDPTEARELFLADLDKEVEREEITRGKGAVTRQIGGEVIKELEAVGKPIRPEEVTALSAGDPFTFYAYTKLFGAAGGLVPAEAKAAASSASRWVGEVGRDITGTALEGIGESARILSKGTTALSKLPSQLIPPSVLPPIVLPLIKRAARIIPDISEGVKSVGKQIRTGEFVSPSARLMADIAETAPGALGDITGGVAFDIGTTAAMAEFPEEEIGGGVGIGTAFGLIGAGRHVTRRVISGQEIAPRVWGGKTQIPTSGPFKGSEFDTLHSTAYQTATPAIKQRVNAVREFMKKSTPGVDLFYVPDKAAFETSLINAGLPAADARLWADQSGVFVKDFNGKRVAFATDIDAAPHESFHPFQDVIGETANKILNQKVRAAYTPEEFELEGQRYAGRLGWDGRGDWRDFTLVASGEGYHATIEKLAQEAANIIKVGEGRETTPEEAKELGTRIFNNAFSDATAANPDTDPSILRRNIWRGILTEAEQKNLADNYAASELAAETWDAVFKHTGPGMKDPKGLIPRFARIAGNLVAAMEGEPLAGRVSQIGELPLKRKAVEAVREAVRGRIETPPLISGESAIPRTPAKPSPLPSGAPAPITAEDRATAAENTRAIAADASDTPVEGGTRSEKELLGEIAAAQAGGDAVKINYLSAPDEPAAAITSRRDVRRQLIEMFRSMPAAARSLWEKNFFPDQVRRTSKGKIQVGGWAPEVFAANAHKTAQTLAKLDPAISPYPIDPVTKSFTEQGWKDLYADTQKFVENQMAGQTGSGETLVVPQSMVDAGFFKPPQEAGTGGLDQRKSDFISAMFGFKLPETPRIQKGKTPLNIAGQIISEATLPGRTEIPVRPRGEYAEPFTGREVLEVNPFRAELERATNAAGVPMPSTIEAFQWLNLENIKEVQHTPEQPQFRANTLTLQAGFSPKMEGTGYESHRDLIDDVNSGKFGEIFGFGYKAENRQNWLKTVADIADSANPLEALQLVAEEKASVKGKLSAKEIREMLFDDIEKLGRVKDQIREARGYTKEDLDFARAKQTRTGSQALVKFSPPKFSDIQKIIQDLKDERWAHKGMKPSEKEYEDAALWARLGLPLKRLGSPSRQAVEEIYSRTGTPPKPGEAKFSPRKDEDNLGRTFDDFVSGFRAAVQEGQPELAQGFLEKAAGAAKFQRTLARKGDVSEFGDRTIDEEFNAQTEQVQTLQKELDVSKKAVNIFLDPGLADKVWEAGGKLKDVPPQQSMEGTGLKSNSELVEKYLSRTGHDEPGWYPTFYRADQGEGQWKVTELRLAAQIADGVNPIADINAMSTEMGTTPERQASFRRAIVRHIQDFETIKNERRIGSGYFGKRAPFSQTFRPGPIKFQAKPNDEMSIRSAAIKDETTGRIYESGIHAIAREDAEARGAKGPFTDGFVTNRKLPNNEIEFLNRDEAFERAEEINQLPAGQLEMPGGGLESTRFEEVRRFSPMPGNPRAIKRAAIKDEKGKIFEGLFHSDANEKAKAAGSKGPFIDGFVTYSEEFLTRAKAFDRAIEIGQLEKVSETAQTRDDLEANLFRQERQFSPAAERKEIELTGPDGKKYRAMFDGYMDMTLINLGWVPQITPLENLPGSKVKGSTTYGPSLEKAGYKLPADLPPPTEADAGGVQFAPRKKKEADPLKFLGTQHGSASKAWILPSGKVEQLGAQWHHDWLSENTEVAAKYKIDVPAFEGTDVEGVREGALRKGFARVNLDNGVLVVEVREKNWRNVRPIIEDLIEKNLDDVDRFRVGLLNDTATDLRKTFTAKLFDADNDQAKMERVYEAFSEDAQREIGRETQFAPKREQFEDPETIREALSSPGWAVITGTQESQGKWNAPANIEANKALEAELQAQGYEYIPVKGTYKGVPQGADFLVLDISTYDAQALGKKYKQESVLTPKGLLYGDGTITEGDTANALLGAEARKQEFFSTLPNGLSFSVPLDFSKAPYQPVGEQSTLFGGREYESPANFTQAELRQRHPEAIVPKNSKEKIGSDIVNSPLYKQSENPVNAFADKLVEFTRQYEDNPVYQLGLKWYSDIVPMLKKEFGKDAPMMTELLAASSPNEKPDMNFFYAVDALEGFKSGRFDKIVSKFNEGFGLYKSDKWLSWYNRELKAGNIVNPPQNPTPEAFLANWIYKHDLKPKQSNGQLYGFHGRAILEVLAGKWLQQNKGPKVGNFVQNLQGTGHEATIDVWADRTMRRIGYADAKNRWRIMPANGEGVSDADFAFSQKAFRAAADKLGIEADSLQGGLWFAEKSLWSENGWGRLDLGSYAVEMGKLSLIRQAIKQRLTKTAQRAKVTPMKTGELKFSPKGENRDILKPGVYSVSTSYGTAKDVDFAGGTTRQLYRKYAGKADEFGFKRMAFTGPDESGEQIDVQPRPTRDY